MPTYWTIVHVSKGHEAEEQELHTSLCPRSLSFMIRRRRHKKVLDFTVLGLDAAKRFYHSISGDIVG
jgi:hypothetical protein